MLSTKQTSCDVEVALRIKHNPPAWEQRKLGDILEEYNEQCEKGGVLKHVSLTKEGVVPKTKRYDRDALVSHENKKYRITNLNDICYNPANLKFGVICRNTLGAGIFSPIYITFHVGERDEPSCVEYLVKRQQFIDKALRNQEGTVYERMAVKPSDLLSMEVTLPCKQEQQRIGTLFQQLDTLITLHQRKLISHEIALISALRKRLQAQQEKRVSDGF